MRRPDRRFVWLAGMTTALALGASPQAHAKADAGAPSARTASPSASAAASAGAEKAAPPIAEDSELPEGHPALDEGNPHAHAGKANGMAGVFEPPEDLEQEDPTLPPGTIKVDLRDPDDHPLPDEMLTLGVLINSVAKGDCASTSRPRRTRTAPPSSLASRRRATSPTASAPATAAARSPRRRFSSGRSRRCTSSCTSIRSRAASRRR